MPTAYAPMTRNFTSAASNDESSSRKSSFKIASVHFDQRARVVVEDSLVSRRQRVELTAQVPCHPRPIVQRDTQPEQLVVLLLFGFRGARIGSRARDRDLPGGSSFSTTLCRQGGSLAQDDPKTRNTRISRALRSEQRQDLGPIMSDDDGVLELSRESTIGGHHRPAVAKRANLA